MKSREHILTASIVVLVALLLVFAAMRLGSICFIYSGWNNWALVAAGLAAVSGFFLSWFLPYRVARIINGAVFGYIFAVLVTWAGCSSFYRTIVDETPIASLDSPDCSMTAVAYRDDAISKIDLNIKLTVETRFLGIFKRSRHLTYEYGADRVSLYWLDKDTLVATFGSDKIYSRKWDL